MADAHPGGQADLPDTQSSEQHSLLLACGILQVAMGTVGLVFFFVGVRLVMNSMNWKILPALPLLGMLGIFLFFCIMPLATGLDSLRLRAWVRPMVLALSRPISHGMAIILSISLYAASSSHEDTSYLATAVFALFLLMPAVLLSVIYRRDDVQDLLTASQPDLAWTEEPPLSLLTLAVWFVVAAACLLIPLAVTLVSPITPHQLRIFAPPSLAMSLLMVGLSLACLVAAMLCFHQRIAGWYLALALDLALIVALAIPTFSGPGLYMPDTSFHILPSPRINALIAFSIPVIALFHLLKARPDFNADPDQPAEVER